MAGPSRPSGSFQLADVYDNMDSVHVSSELTSLATLPTFHEESQGSLGDFLARVPPEIVSMILHSLVDEELPKHVYRSVRSERRFLSRSSLVCRKWLSIQRPKLFEDLTIRNSAELRFLLNVLRQQRDGRLASEVIYLHIMCQDVSLTLDRICRLLTGKLPAVRHIDLALQKYQSVSAQSLRLFCTSQASLRRLEIYRVGFISFSAFFHALQDMASVEELSLRYNTWGGVEERPPTRISLAGFPNLRFVDVDGKPIHCRMSAFLFAPALARRCEVIPGRVNAHNSDSSLLSMLVKSCCPEKSDEGVGLTYDKANDKISFHSFAKTVDVDLWPTASLAANGKWSVIRSIQWVGFAKPEIDEIDWESLDKVILTDATRLLEIRIGLISDDYWDTFSIRLPELTKLEKVTLEVGGRELHTGEEEIVETDDEVEGRTDEDEEADEGEDAKNTTRRRGRKRWTTRSLILESLCQELC